MNQKNRNENRVVVWDNRPKKNPRGPELGGSLYLTDEMISRLASMPRDRDGIVELKVALWINQGPRGSFYAGPVEEKREGSGGGGYGGGQKQRENRREDPQDEIPF